MPKIASPSIKADDPAVNEHISYAKCIKGHVLKDANDWICCEHLPASTATCWQEGGETLFTLRSRTDITQEKNQREREPQETMKKLNIHKVTL